jgi:hypothetical protein
VGSHRVLVELVDFPLSGDLLEKNVVYDGVKRTKFTDNGIEKFGIADAIY